MQTLMSVSELRALLGTCKQLHLVKRAVLNEDNYHIHMCVSDLTDADRVINIVDSGHECWLAAADARLIVLAVQPGMLPFFDACLEAERRCSWRLLSGWWWSCC